MNQLESRYAEHLEARRLAGEIVRYDYELVAFKLAHDCRYHPDFMVMLADGTIEFHETKGFMRGDADVKLRVAAAQTPFIFRLITRSKDGAWNISEVGAPRKQDVPPVEEMPRGISDAVPHGTSTAPKKRKPTMQEKMDAVAAWRSTDPIPDGFCSLDGKLMTLEYAMEKVRG